MSCVIVLGCFRSGTSAVAGVLHHLGVVMGKSFDEPNKNNPQGFWEDLEFKRIHKWYEETSGVDELIDDSYKKLIRQRESEHELWGVKDPLLCMFLPRLVRFLKTDHRLIVCRRSIEGIADSMVRSMGYPTDNALFRQLAEHYVEQMAVSLDRYQGPVHEVQFSELATCVPGMAQFVGLEPNEAALSFIR